MISASALVILILGIIIFVKGGLKTPSLVGASICLGLALANTPGGQTVLGWLNDGAAAVGAFVESIV